MPFFLADSVGAVALVPASSFSNLDVDGVRSLLGSLILVNQPVRTGRAEGGSPVVWATWAPVSSVSAVTGSPPLAAKFESSYELPGSDFVRFGSKFTKAELVSRISFEVLA